MIFAVTIVLLAIVVLRHFLRVGNRRIDPLQTSWWAWYSAYLQSPEWKEKAARCRARAGYRCQHCGRGNCRLQCHHLIYDRVGRELDEDLIALCDECHQARHPNRRIA